MNPMASALARCLASARRPLTQAWRMYRPARQGTCPTWHGPTRHCARKRGRPTPCPSPPPSALRRARGAGRRPAGIAPGSGAGQECSEAGDSPFSPERCSPLSGGAWRQSNRRWRPRISVSPSGPRSGSPAVGALLRRAGLPAALEVRVLCRCAPRAPVSASVASGKVLIDPAGSAGFFLARCHRCRRHRGYPQVFRATRPVARRRPIRAFGLAALKSVSRAPATELRQRSGKEPHAPCQSLRRWTRRRSAAAIDASRRGTSARPAGGSRPRRAFTTCRRPLSRSRGRGTCD